MLETSSEGAFGPRPPERVPARHGIHRRVTKARAAVGALGVAILALGTAVAVPAIGSGNTPAAQFSVVNGSNRAATGSPKPASGLQAALWANSSIATTTLTGSGLVSIGALGQNCDGWPTVKISVDGHPVGLVTITGTANYGNYPATTAVKAGAHKVQIQFTNDHYVAKKCDRNVFIGSAKIQYPGGATPTTTTKTAAPAVGGKPGASNTGVPAGTRLTVSNGDMNITRNGTVVNGLDIRGFVRINADNVTIKNSVIRGGYGSRTNLSLVAAYWNHTNLLIQDSTLAAQHPSYWIDGIKASSFTLNRVEITGVVDSVQVINAGHATITNSWLHGNVFYSSDPLQSNRISHNDNVQVQGGAGTVIKGNTLQNGTNSAIQVTEALSQINGLTVSGNWLSGGACTVNMTQAGKGSRMLGVSITNNRFGPGSFGKTCPMLVPGTTSALNISGNVWDADGSPALPRNR